MEKPNDPWAQLYDQWTEMEIYDGRHPLQNGTLLDWWRIMGSDHLMGTQTHDYVGTNSIACINECNSAYHA